MAKFKKGSRLNDRKIGGKVMSKEKSKWDDVWDDYFGLGIGSEAHGRSPRGAASTSVAPTTTVTPKINKAETAALMASLFKPSNFKVALYDTDKNPVLIDSPVVPAEEGESPEHLQAPKEYLIAYDGIHTKLSYENPVFAISAYEKADGIIGCSMVKPPLSVDLFKKIPVKYFLEIANAFRVVAKDHPVEFAAQIYYNKTAEEFFVYIPEKQKVSGGTVDYSADTKSKFTLRVEHDLVMEIHSHVNMGAFFSGTDSANEQEPRLYMVIGKLLSPKFECLLRAKVKNQEVKLDVTDVFDLGDMTEEQLFNPEELISDNTEYLRVYGTDVLSKIDNTPNVRAPYYGIGASTTHLTHTRTPHESVYHLRDESGNRMYGRSATTSNGRVYGFNKHESMISGFLPQEYETFDDTLDSNDWVTLIENSLIPVFSELPDYSLIRLRNVIATMLKK